MGVERQRGALMMRELGGLEYSEIGSALRMSSVAARRVPRAALRCGRASGCREAACVGARSPSSGRSTDERPRRDDAAGADAAGDGATGPEPGRDLDADEAARHLCPDCPAGSDSESGELAGAELPGAHVHRHAVANRWPQPAEPTGARSPYLASALVQRALQTAASVGAQAVVQHAQAALAQAQDQLSSAMSAAQTIVASIWHPQR
jgi:hypothetical protein